MADYGNNTGNGHIDHNDEHGHSGGPVNNRDNGHHDGSGGGDHNYHHQSSTNTTATPHVNTDDVMELRGGMPPKRKAAAKKKKKVETSSSDDDSSSPPPALAPPPSTASSAPPGRLALPGNRSAVAATRRGGRRVVTRSMTRDAAPAAATRTASVAGDSSDPQDSPSGESSSSAAAGSTPVATPTSHPAAHDSSAGVPTAPVEPRSQYHPSAEIANTTDEGSDPEPYSTPIPAHVGTQFDPSAEIANTTDEGSDPEPYSTPTDTHGPVGIQAHLPAGSIAPSPRQAASATSAPFHGTGAQNPAAVSLVSSEIEDVDSNLAHHQALTLSSSPPVAEEPVASHNPASDIEDVDPHPSQQEVAALSSSSLDSDEPAPVPKPTSDHDDSDFNPDQQESSDSPGAPSSPAEDTSSDSNGNRSSASPPAKRTKHTKSEMLRSRSEEVASQEEMGVLDDIQPAVKPLPVANIWTDFENHNKAKVQRALKGINLASTKFLVTSARTGVKHSLDLLLSLPVLRNFSSRATSWTTGMQPGGTVNRGKVQKQQWQLEVFLPDSTEIFVIARLWADDYTQSEARILCEELVEIYNRWPGPLHLISHTIAGFKATPPASKMILHACLIKRFPAKAIICHLPKFYTADTKRPARFICNSRILDPTTYTFYQDAKELTATNVRAMGHVPEVTDRYQFVEVNAKDTVLRRIKKESQSAGAEPTFATLLPSQDELDEMDINDAEKEGLLKAERVCRMYFASLALHGRILNKQAAKDLWRGIIESHGGHLQKGDDESALVFQGKQLFKIYHYRHNSTTAIIPGHLVSEMLKEIDPSYEFPPLVIRTTNRAWCKPVEQVIHDVWTLEGDLKEAWSRGAEAADEVNRAVKDGDKPPNFCNCTPEMSITVSHDCAGCGRRLICSQLSVSKYDGQRVCSSCDSRRIRWKADSHASQLLNRMAKVLVDIDVSKSGGGISHDEAEQTKQQLYAAISASLPTADEAEAAGVPHGTAFKNHYTGKIHSIQVDSVYGSRTDPERPSLDAVFPAWLTENGYRIHVPENVRITTSALNYVKQIHIPAFLHVLCWYLKRVDAIKEEYESDLDGVDARRAFEEARTQMVNYCSLVRDIRLGFAWTVKGRIRAAVDSPEKFAYDLEPVIAGRRRRHAGKVPWEEPGFISSEFVDKHLDWPNDELNRVQCLVDEMQEHFGVKLDKSADNCPYPFHPSTKPSNWSWQVAMALMSERWERMRTRCNQFWPTSDTPVTIFLECVFQVCIAKCRLFSHDPQYEEKKALKSEYASILELPMGIAFHDPLTMAVAHKVHGEGMYTGWPVHATELRERLENNKLNNIFIEPRTENFLKMDYHTSTYPSLRQQVLDVKLPKDVYDRGVIPSEEDFLEDWKNLPWDGDFEIGDYEDNFLQPEEELGEELDVAIE